MSIFFRKMQKLNIEDFIFKGTKLIINNALNRYTLYSGLIIIFINYCNITAMKELLIENAKKTRIEKQKEPDKKDGWNTNKGMSYKRKRELNNITEIILRTYVELSDFETGINYFNENQIESNQEIKLYVLVSILLKYGETEPIKKEIEKNMNIKPRKALLDVLDYIKKFNKLPDHL